MHMSRRPDNPPACRLTGIAIACAGAGLIVCAIAANQRWLDAHFLPDFFVPHATFVAVETVIRVAVAVIGLAVILLHRSLARFLTCDLIRTGFVIVAIGASLGVSEASLRRTHIRAKEEVRATKEPRRFLDAQLGWLFVPSRAGYQTINGRRIEYAFDRSGYRVPRVGDTVDFERPTILFTGESIMVGEKLQWAETIPAQTAAMMNLQSANLAVSGFASDQAFLRLRAELPRFHHPVAVVTLFSPALFDRNLDADRPGLGPGLVWHPAERRSRLSMIVRRLLRYRTDEAIESGIRVTREVLRAGDDLARSRGAVPLIVVPEFGEETIRERELRQRILDEERLPYVLVRLDPAWRVPGDGHPDARGARAIATAISVRLAFFMHAL
jgi:hypothetical protein